MIVRAWRGVAATRPNADAYTRHLDQSVFPHLLALPGHRGAWLLRRDVEGRIEFLVLTLWDSMAAIRGFAGDTAEQAVVEPEARAVLAEFDPRVIHYEVVIAPPSLSPLRP